MLKSLIHVLILAGLTVSSASADMETANQYLRNGDHARAAEEFRKLADEGNPKAQSHLGYMYYTGDGVPQSFSEAMKWYEKAAVQGDRDAQYNLAVAYAFGEGVKQDFKDAAIWYRRAAEQGHAAAQYSLGISYAYGEGVEQDQQIAGEWFLKSAAAGYVNAQVMVGSMYHTGEGLLKDYSQAASWYLKAAEQGNAAAQYNLGTLYRAGKGVDKDIDEAIKWLRKAADQGYESAQNELSSLERSMAAALETPVTPAETVTGAATPAPQSATTPPPEMITTPPVSPPETAIAAETETSPQEDAAPPPVTPEEKPDEIATTEPAITPEVTQEPQEPIHAPEADTDQGKKSGGFLAGLKEIFTPSQEQTPATAEADIPGSADETPPVPTGKTEDVPAPVVPQPVTPKKETGEIATIEPQTAITPEVAQRSGENTQPPPEPDVVQGKQRGGFMAGLKKFFTPPQEQVTATAKAEAQESTTEEAAPPEPDKTEDVVTATAYPATEGAPAPAAPQLTPEQPVRKVIEKPAQDSPTTAQAETPPRIDVTSDFHKLFGDKRKTRPPEPTEEAGGTQAASMTPTETPSVPLQPSTPAAPERQPGGAAPAVAAVTDEPRATTPEAATEPQVDLPTSPPQTSTPSIPEPPAGEAAPAVAAVTAESGTVTPEAGAKKQAGSTTGTEDTGGWRPGGLRRIFDKFLTGKRDTGPAEQSAVPEVSDEKTTAAPEPAAVAIPASVPADTETVPAETTKADSEDDKPLVVAKAEPDTVAPTLAESAAEKLQTPLDELTSSAVEGDFEAQYQLGKKYYLGDGVTKDKEQAFIWLRRAAEQGHADAQFQLGSMYLMGDGVRQNDDEAMAWYTQAADQGHDAARQNLEKLQRLDEQREVRETDTAISSTEAEPSEKKGGVLGTLGKFFSSDKGEQGPEPESEHAPDETESNTATATDASIAEITVTAVPGQNDYERGLAYNEGDGVPQDYLSAFKLFRSAAEQNHAPAQFQLGNAYLGGQGIEKDPEAAVSWYEKSARQGYAPAQRTLGNLYMYGAEGVTVNKTLAYAWYSILSREGNMLDQHRRDTLRAELSDAELRESEQMKQKLTAALPALPSSN